MIQIGETILSRDLFDHDFCCDYQVCKGICCVEGDGGPPLEPGEREQIQALLPHLRPMMSPRAIEVLGTQGLSYTDEDGDEAISIVDGGDCIFTTYPEGDSCHCAIELLYEQGLTDFPKPLSCHLYPIRLTRYATFTALNYHRWSVCRSAVKLGRSKGMPIYQFLRTPLIRAFGADWYEEVCTAARLLEG